MPVCAICGKGVKNVYTCNNCGATVCSEHFDKESGMCEKCSATGGGKVMS